jgi:hypothetical protein
MSGPYAARLPKHLSELGRIGRLRRKQVDHVEQWDGYEAAQERLTFDGLVIDVIVFSNDPERYNLAGLSIESTQWSMSFFGIGSSSEAALKEAGVPPPRKSGAWRLRGESDSIYVQAQNGRIYRVVYECYAG